MTLNNILKELLSCLGMEDSYIVSWEQTQRWPSKAINIFQKSGWLKKTLPATTVECTGCINNCFMTVQYYPEPHGKSSKPFVNCDVPPYMGKIEIPLKLLQQWQLTYTQITEWICRKLNLRSNHETETEKTDIKLGSIKGNQRIAELYIDFTHPISLKTSGHRLPLSEIIYIKKSQLHLDQLAILYMIDLPPAIKYKNKITTTKKKTTVNNTADVGSVEWRKNIARNAANARHSKPGGAHDKQQKIREIWATGKYRSRDRCAEEECAGLDMSFSAARRALRNFS